MSSLWPLLLWYKFLAFTLCKGFSSLPGLTLPYPRCLKVQVKPKTMWEDSGPWLPIATDLSSPLALFGWQRETLALQERWSRWGGGGCEGASLLHLPPCTFICWVSSEDRPRPPDGGGRGLGWDPPRLAPRFAPAVEETLPGGSAFTWTPACIRHKDTLVTALPKPAAIWLIFHSFFIFLH